MLNAVWSVVQLQASVSEAAFFFFSHFFLFEVFQNVIYAAVTLNQNNRNWTFSNLALPIRTLAINSWILCDALKTCCEFEALFLGRWWCYIL